MSVSHALPRAGVVGALLLLGPLASAQDAWVSVPSGTNLELRAVHFPTPEVGYVAGAGGTVLRSVDGGLTWADASPDDAPDLHGVHFFNLEIGVVVGDEGATYRTLNAGIDWTLIPSGVQVPLFTVSFSGNVGIAAGGSQTIVRSVDGGISWSPVQGDFFGGGFRGAHMLDATSGFVAGENSIFQPLFGATDDGGAGFDFTAFYLNSNEGWLSDVYFHTPTTGVASGVTWDGQGSLSRTADGGATWTTTLFPLPLATVGFATAEVGFAAGDGGGLLKTTDGGLTWAPTPPLGSAQIRAVDFPTANLGFAVGTSGTIYRGTISTASEPTGDERELTLQAYPNPIVGASTVRFALPVAGEATVALHDALGRRVAVVASGSFAAGTHDAVIDAGDLRPGVYLLTLEAAGRRTSRVLVAGR